MIKVCLFKPKTNLAIQKIGNKSELRSLNEHTIVVSSVALKIILIAQTNVQEIQYDCFDCSPS